MVCIVKIIANLNNNNILISLVIEFSLYWESEATVLSGVTSWFDMKTFIAQDMFVLYQLNNSLFRPFKQCGYCLHSHILSLYLVHLLDLIINFYSATS